MPSIAASFLLLVAAATAVASVTSTAAAVESSNNSHVRQLFEQFKASHGKTYRTVAEEDWRLRIFSSNLARIRQLNEENGSPAFGITAFADLTVEEFRSLRTMSVPLPGAQPDGNNNNCPYSSKHLLPYEQLSSLQNHAANDLPATFDWRAKGAVTAVRDQGSAGSCWAFSAAQTLEGQEFLTNGVLAELSPEQLVDCDALDCGVFGGWPCAAFEYILTRGGLQREADYPYCAGMGGCFPCMANKNTTFCGPPPSYCNRTCLFDASKPVVKVRSFTPIPQNDQAIAQSLVNFGPLSVSINADPLQMYTGGILNLDSSLCDPTSLNHAVLLVGYGEKKRIFGKEEHFWIVKNSWGTDWAPTQGGYFYVSRDTTDTRGICGMNTGVSIAFVDKQ